MRAWKITWEFSILMSRKNLLWNGHLCRCYRLRDISLSTGNRFQFWSFAICQPQSWPRKHASVLFICSRCCCFVSCSRFYPKTQHYLIHIKPIMRFPECYKRNDVTWPNILPLIQKFVVMDVRLQTTVSFLLIWFANFYSASWHTKGPTFRSMLWMFLPASRRFLKYTCWWFKFSWIH